MREIRHNDKNTDIVNHAHGKNFQKAMDVKGKILKKISLIIPVLEEEKILEETLNNYTTEMLNKYNVELIISDGGSHDRTLDISRQFSKKVIEYNGSSKQTISAGRNSGAEKADGDIFVFINGDSYPENAEKFFELIYDWANNKGIYKNFIALTCWVTIHPEEMLLKDKIFYAIHNRYIMLLNFISVGMGRGECQIVKREYFERVNGYDEKLAAGEDFDLFKRLAKIGKIGFIKEIKIYESPRRFRKYGYFKVILQWIINSISVMVYGKSVSEEWDPVR